MRRRLVAAQQLCEDLMAEVNSSSATEAIATVYITLSRLLHRRQQTVRATRLLEQLASILQLGNYARFVSQLAQESLRQAYISGKSANLDSLAQRYRLAELLAEGYWDSARPHDECWERYGLACVYWLLGRGAKVRACRLLKVLDESLRHSELSVRRLIIEANLMVAGNSQPDLAAQRQELLRLLDAYGMVNISRSVFDEAPGFGPGLLALVCAEPTDTPAVGLKLLNKVQADFEEIAKVEYAPRMEGRQMIMILAPK